MVNKWWIKFFVYVFVGIEDEENWYGKLLVVKLEVVIKVIEDNISNKGFYGLIFKFSFN